MDIRKTSGLLRVFAVAAALLGVPGVGFGAGDELVLHVIVQSHLDPVWLWDRAAGTDAAIATMRTMCDVLDAYPEVHVTRGESWVYETVEQCDPATFARVKRHVAAGRLHVVGGTYVQPDCNGPAAVSFRKQYEIGGKYFRERFGIGPVKTGYNPDSFGHCAYLPKFLREAGCENYIFMRPQTHEKDLPTVFRWQSPSGEEVLVARIIGSCYNSDPDEGLLSYRLRETIDRADRRYGHAMCFIGVGDHGGGPARREIEWIAKHRGDYPGVKVVFSHPDAFFAALRASGVEPPLVVGELQHHAVGCYTALSRIKREVRLTEDALVRSGALLSEGEREAAWKTTAFAGFHDIYGGTCILSAYDDIFEGLAGVRARIRDAEILRTRRLNAALPPDPCQRLVFDNPGPEAFSGLCVFEPWINGAESYYSWSEAANATVRIRDERGDEVVFQRVPHDEKSERSQPRLVTHLDVPAGGRRILRLDYAGQAKAAPAARRAPAQPVPEFAFEVIDEETDTWSHSIKGYPPATRTMREAGDVRTVTDGPCLGETIRHFACPGGDVWVRTAHETGLNGVHLRIRAVWTGVRQVVKLSIKPPFKVARRTDGTPGGELVRQLDGEEFPLQRYLRLEGAAGEGLACVSADITAGDVQPDGTIRLTLFRTPYACHHGPHRGLAPLKSDLLPVLDLGVHDIDLVILREPTPADIAREVYRQTNPLVFSETTYGVKPILW